MCFTQRTFLWKISSNFLKFNLIFITVSPLWLKAVTVKGYCWSSVQAGLLRFGPVLHRWRQNVYLLSSLLKFALLDVSSRRQITLTQASMIRSHDSRKANLGKSLHWVFTWIWESAFFLKVPQILWGPLPGRSDLWSSLIQLTPCKPSRFRWEGFVRTGPIESDPQIVCPVWFNERHSDAWHHRQGLACIISLFITLW